MSRLIIDVLVENQDEWGGWTVPQGGSTYADIIWNDDATPPTEEEFNNAVTLAKPIIAMKALREHRNELLKETDVWALGDRTMTQEQTDYRQALRDLPVNNPNVTIENDLLVNYTLPTKPTE